MGPVTLFNTALAALWMNKLRTSLTLLGIVIGVAAVIALMGLGRGAQQSIVDNITSLGTNLIFVQPQHGGFAMPVPVVVDGGRGTVVRTSVPGQQSQAGRNSELTLEDAYALLDPVYAPSVKAAAPEFNTSAQIVAGRQNRRVQIVGATPDYLSVRNARVQYGNFISQPHVNARSEVLVLGHEISRQLFGLRDPSGQIVRVNGREYRVLGVLERRGTGPGGQLDHQVIVPITTAYYRIDGRGSTTGGMPVQTITVEAEGEGAVDRAMQEVISILRLRHRVTDQQGFAVTSQQQMIDALRGTTNTFIIFLAAIAGISLVVGGIGIMNIMLVSVTERTREIGVRKALGARRHDILLQFSIEAVLLSLAGGAIGVVFGYALARAASALGALGGIGGPGQNLQAVFAPDIAILALVVSAGIGLFFGIYPAVRAARLQPVEALRHQ